MLLAMTTIAGSLFQAIPSLVSHAMTVERPACRQVLWFCWVSRCSTQPTLIWPIALVHPVLLAISAAIFTAAIMEAGLAWPVPARS
jgi:hypothetical protein